MSMGKAINIKDPATCALVAELASKTGVSMVQAVNQAVSKKLADIEAERLAGIEAWLDRLAANPLTDDCWVEPEDQPMPLFDTL
jgi:hypothetical protein